MRAPATETARRLRRDATDAERLFWQSVRSRQLGGHKLRRQVPVGPYFADFLCAERRLVVELDGGQHDEDRDRARTAFLEQSGYRVVRYWNNDVVGNLKGVLTALLGELAVPVATPSPNPLPRAGEG